MLRGQLLQWRSLQRLGFILILICALMRFVNLGTKPYWYDEVYTSLRLSGYTKVEILEQVGTEQKRFESLQIFQCPSNDRHLGDTQNSLIIDDSHPPLYFTLLYYWIKGLGCTVAKARLLSAVLSLLLIPIGYALVYEIFRSQAIALLATAFVANSPLFLMYAQEARSYILFLDLALFSSLMLLRFLRCRNTKNIVLYGIVSTAGLYCHTLYYGVILAQVLYCLLNDSGTPLLTLPLSNFDVFRKSILLRLKQYQYILIALSISLFAFLLWILRVIQVQGFVIRAGADYTWKEFSVQILWQRIILNLVSILDDFESSVKFEILAGKNVRFSLLDLNWNDIILIVLISAFLLCSLCYTIHSSTNSDRSPVVLLGWLALPSILFLVKDLVLGGSASTIVRYQLLSIFGLYVCLSFCLINLWNLSRGKFFKVFVLGLMVISIQLQIHSNFNYLNAPSWWSKYGDYQLKNFADQVNHSSRPLIICEENYREMVNLLKLSYVLNPSIPFQLVGGESQENIPEAILKDYDIFWVPKI